MPKPSHDQGVLRAARSVGAAVLLSRLLGLVREQVFAYFFGAGLATDAFNVAFRVPNLLRNIFAEGAMSASLIPTFTSTRINEGDERAWQVAGRVLRVLATLGGVIAVLGILGASHLVRLYAPAFVAQPEKYEMTVRLTRLMFPYFPCVALAAALTAVLNTCGKFFIPALSSVVFNLVSVGVGVAGIFLINHQIFPGTFSGFLPIEAMAIGVVLGGAAQVLFQLPLLYRAGYHYQSKGQWLRDPAIRRMMLLMIPGVVGLAATQINVLISTFLATSLPQGSVSWLSYSFRFVQFPIGLVGATLATASLPVFARLWNAGQFGDFGAILEQNLKRVLFLNIPASVGLGVLGYPIIEMVFQYGKFHSSDTRATSMALLMYSIGLVGYSGIKILVPACYAIGITRIPVVSSLMSVALSTILSLIFIYGFHWDFWALALATSLGAIFNFTYLSYQLRLAIQKAGGRFALGSIAISGLRIFALAALMGAVVYFSYAAMVRFTSSLGDGLEVRLLRVIPILFLGAAVFSGSHLFKKNTNFATKP